MSVDALNARVKKRIEMTVYFIAVGEGQLSCQNPNVWENEYMMRTDESLRFEKGRTLIKKTASRAAKIGRRK